jgi:hypothetical protein
MSKNFVVKHGLEIASGGITINQGGLNIVGGDITLPSVLRIGTASGADRFPNTVVSISNTTISTKPSELHNIGLLAEGTANSSDTTVYGVGVYGIGYTAGATRSGGVVGEGHVSDTTDTGSAIGVRGYSSDNHASGMNIGLYGSAANGLTNYALYMPAGNIYTGSSQSWTLGGDLTFSGAYAVTIPTLSLTNALPVLSGGTGVTTSTGSGSVVLSNSAALATITVGTSLGTPSTSFNLINANATTVNFAGAASELNISSGTGTTTINNDLVVAGNITFGSGATQLSATVLNIEDPLIYLADNNVADTLDVGIIGAYKINDVHLHTGIIRDASDKVWKLFSGITSEPVGNVLDLTDAVYDDFQIGKLSTTGVNKVTITEPDTSAVLTLANGSTLATSGAHSITLTATADSVITLPTTGTLVSTTTTALSDLSTVGTVTTGTWSASFGAVSGANLTDLTAGNLSGTIPSTVLANSSVYIGNTTIALNRESGDLALTGVSIDGASGALATTTSPVVVSGTASPAVGQVLTAISATSAQWSDIPESLGSTGTVTSVSGQGTVNGITLSGVVTLDGHLTLGGTLSGVDLTTQITGILPVVNGGSGTTSSTGTGNLVLATSPDIGTSLTTSSTSFNLINANATTVNFAGAATALSVGSATGNTTVNNNLVVSGDLTVNGTNNIINTTSINVQDPMISMASGNTVNSVDIGFYGLYNSNTTSKYTGFVRDASDSNTWKLFDNVPILPDTTVDFTSATYSPIRVGTITGTSLNNVTITAPANGATLTLANNSTLSTAGNFTTTGAYAITLTATADTSVTLPTTGTLLSSASTVFNKVTITTPTNTATLTLANNSTLSTAGNFTTSGAYPITLTATAATTVTLPTTGALVADGYTTTATAAGTTTLTNASTSMQVFTGTTTQTVKLPDTATLSIGKRFTITNNSTGTLTIQTSAAGAVATQTAGTTATYTVASIGAQTWVSAIVPLISSVNGVDGIVSDVSGNLRSIPQVSKSAAYTLVAGDNGKNINITTGGITIPTSSVFIAGDVISIYNRSGSAQNISWSGGTVYSSGTSAAKSSPLSLAARGIATIMFVTGGTSPEIVVSGNV